MTHGQVIRFPIRAHRINEDLGVDRAIRVPFRTAAETTGRATRHFQWTASLPLPARARRIIWKEGSDSGCKGGLHGQAFPQAGGASPWLWQVDGSEFERDTHPGPRRRFSSRGEIVAKTGKPVREIRLEYSYDRLSAAKMGQVYGLLVPE